MFTSLFKKQLEDAPVVDEDPAPRVLWVHGRNSAGKGWKSLGWQLMGVYTTQGQAIDSCENERDWIGPVTENEPMPEDAEWDGVWYPAVQARPGEYVER